MEHFKLPIALLIIAITIDLYVALLAWRRRSVSGGISLFFLMLAVTEWTMFVLVELFVEPLPLKILSTQLSYIGSQTAPVLFLLLVFSLTKDTGRLQSRFVPFLFVVPFISILLAFTNQNHGLIWTGFTPYPGVEGVIQYNHGLLYWVLVIGYSYLCLLVGILEILATIIKRKYTYRWQAVSLLVAALLPWIGNLFYVLKIGPFPGIDSAPIPFSLVGMVLAFSIYQFRLLEISPVARDVLFETMIDSLIVLDPKDRIIDINPAGQRLLGIPYKDIIGSPTSSLSNFHLIEVLRRDPNQTHQTEILWGQNQDRVLDISVIPLTDKKKHLTGRLLVARDITEAQIMENKLQRANETLKEQLDQIKALQETLREQTIRDPLTGLYNRRFLDDMLALQISQAKQDNSMLSLVMIDLDRFKKLNDAHGHSAGDAVMKHLASILKAKTRHGDFACRFGGEEFVIMMPGASLAAAMRRAEEWRKEFQDQTVFYEGKFLKNTFSAGVATFPTHAITAEELIKAADQGLYLSKNSGRNRVASIDIDSVSIPEYHHEETIS